jgi:arabinose-5-phosphate isomerase
MAIDAMELMETNEISQLLVEENGKYAGVVHLHDLIKEGII